MTFREVGEGCGGGAGWVADAGDGGGGGAGEVGCEEAFPDA